MVLLLNLCMALHAGALMGWFGALSLRRVLGAGQGGGEMRFLQISASVALASGALWPWLQSGVLGETPDAAWDPAQVAVVLTQTGFGRTWLMREAGIALATLVSFAPLLAIGRGAYFLVAAALASVALLGHTAGVSGAAGMAPRLALAAHLLAAGAWVGALPALWVLAGRLAARDLVKVLRLFSRYGLVLVAIVLASGALSAWYRIGSWPALFGSNYGQILIAKVALVSAMGLAALANRNRYTPRLAQADAFVQAGGRAGLRRSIALELLLGLAVIAAAVWLAAAEAPR
jgi:putative copper resistance protein D